MSATTTICCRISTTKSPADLNNGRIADELMKLDLKGGIDAIGENLFICYAMMVDRGLVGRGEMDLVRAWTNDCLPAGYDANFSK